MTVVRAKPAATEWRPWQTKPVHAWATQPYARIDAGSMQA